jgi:hypothetical protein
MTGRRIKGLALTLGLAAVGCGGQSIVEGPGPTTSSTLCASDPNAPNAGGPGKSRPTFGGTASQFPPAFGTTITAKNAPPAISGGTLRIMADGRTAVAADPDRDQVYVVDLTSRSVTSTFKLSPGDEPGRVVIDGVGRAHVALRRGGALVSFDPRVAPSAQSLTRRSVCAAPRGVAYDSGTDVVHVACSDGQLVSLPAAGGDAVRTLTLERDLRDVVVDGPRLKVSRFRSTEVLTVEADGTVSGRTSPQAFSTPDARNTQRFTPSIAYKMEALPNGEGVVMVHQRGLMDEVQAVAGGYGGGSFDPGGCQSIVHPAVTMVASDGTIKSGPALAGLVLAVDLAVSHDGNRIAVISAGNATNRSPGDTSPDLPRVFVTSLEASTDEQVGCRQDGTHAPCPAAFDGVTSVVSDPDTTGTGGTSPTDTTGAGGEGGAAGAADSGGDTGAGGTTGSSGGAGDTGTGGSGGTGETGTAGGFGTGGGGSAGMCTGRPDPSVPQVAAFQPIAVAFDGSDHVVVQSREPALLALPGNVTITLSADSRADTGHDVFHANSGGFLACASCHAEGNDDGRVWKFACFGERRTQSLQTGIKGTEPFHWSGDESDFTNLMNDVFVGRMSGPLLTSEQNNALFHWVDAQPLPVRTAPADAAAVARGKTLFDDPAGAACVTCHTGTKFTNAQTVDVGTGAPFQVPSLVGVGTRGPYMHNGCAKTLEQRFTNTACGGGDAHGHTSNLTPSEISDLLAYLNSI